MTETHRPPSTSDTGSGRGLADYAADWEANAQADARYAILSDPASKGGTWDDDTFMSTGELEISRVFAELDRLGVVVSRRGTCLDFGCGLGRLTQALGRRFDQAIGVDVSPTMVSGATELAEAGGIDNVRFVLNQQPDLAQFDTGSIDFVYSNIVLQHVSSELQLGYLREFGRVLAPGGLAVVQLPSRRTGIRGLARRLTPDALLPLARRIVRPPAELEGDGYRIRMEMNCQPEGNIAELAAAMEATIIHIRYTNAAEPAFAGNVDFFDRKTAVTRARGGGYLSPVYVIRRR
ncbi:MAG: class I SAM-dependent methyltransferase [Acidimicrobiales bacterium]